MEPTVSSLSSPARLLAEAGRTARAQVFTSVLLLLIAFSGSLTVVATRGRAVVSSRLVRAQLERVENRTIAVRDVTGTADISTGDVLLVEAMSTVERTLGVGQAFDVENVLVAGGTPVPARYVTGLSASRAEHQLFAPAIAVVDPTSRQRLGLAVTSGAVTRPASGEQWPVVSSVEYGNSLAELRGSVAIVDPAWQGPVRSLFVIVDAAASVDTTVDGIRLLLADRPPGTIAVEQSSTIAELRTEVQREVNRFGRSVVALAVGAAVVLSTAVVAASLGGRRKDFGRRRALGATRLQLVTVVAASTSFPVLLGSIAGALTGAVTVRKWLGASPQPAFIGSTVAVIVLSTVIASIAPAFAAAMRDPIRAIRVP